MSPPPPLPMAAEPLQREVLLPGPELQPLVPVPFSPE
jgi:hypothetical protein